MEPSTLATTWLRGRLKRRKSQVGSEKAEEMLPIEAKRRMLEVNQLDKQDKLLERLCLREKTNFPAEQVRWQHSGKTYSRLRWPTDQIVQTRAIKGEAKLAGSCHRTPDDYIYVETFKLAQEEEESLSARRGTGEGRLNYGHQAWGRKTRAVTVRRQAPRRSLLVILVLLATGLACLASLLAFGKDGLTFGVAAYQLTNNLIANNLPPKFLTSGAGSNSEIVVRVKEGPSTIGKLIYVLKGEDPDEDPLTFGVLGSTASDLLRIENVPGNQANVYLRKELDRETTESHQVVITLTDGKLGRGNWITKSMLIIVEDVNDNHPVFSAHRTAISVREDAKVPLVIETVEASDQDEGRFGQVIYKLDESSEELTGSGGQRVSMGSFFSVETIDGRGVVSVIAPLDYEQRALYQLRILATDRAVEGERLTASTSILVSVEDCEDQPPMFTFVPSITRIPENLPVGSPVVRVSAVDGDRGINNRISYALLAVNGVQDSGHLFTINQDSGLVSVGGKLDRESSQESSSPGRKSEGEQQPGSYVLQVRASELNSAQSNVESSVVTELTVLLTDVNDELPTFKRANYFGEILENSAPESLVSFIAPKGQALDSAQLAQLSKVLDRDQGTNGTFSLELEGEHSRLFEIWPREATNEANFVIKIAPSVSASELDFERRKQFQLTLVAREKYSSGEDSGGQLRFTSAQMSVFLRDANDNYPQFEHDLYRVEIPENAIKGMHVSQVRAFDLDSGQFGSEGIRYTEIRGEKANKFKLDPITGVITLKSSEHGFDRETVPQHHLIIEARDSFGQGNRNTTQLLIVLTDVNDQPPKFLLEQYEAFIYENEPDFQSPLQVQAVDNDAQNSPNSRITYSILAGDPQANFTIDSATGRIRVRGQTLSALPGDKFRASTEADVSNLTGSSEQAGGGLDFERIAQKRDETRQFNLTVKATDQGVPEPLSDTTNVLILVYDKNDHAPIFTRPIYHKSLKEDAKEGQQVLQVVAQDGDHSPTNSKITYRISSGAGDKFVIDAETGLISVANGANLDIDRATGGQKRTNYLLTVLAFDGSFGPNQKSASALVNITILDVNNKPPEFTSLGVGRSAGQGSFALGAAQTTLAPNQPTSQQQYMVAYVSEDAPYGLIVTRVQATDLDSSAELRYSINYARSEARNDDMQLVDPSLLRDLFSIDPSEGTIKVAKPLDRETFDQVKLRLQVEDIAAQSADQVAHAHLLIKITDINDNRPTFKRSVYKAVVNENSISGTSVITLAADDKDLNKTLKYFLDGSPEMMRLVRINSRSGEVTVNDKIDRELYSMINVTVKAEDYGLPHSLTGSAQLVITVRDENDNNPSFVNSSHLLTGSQLGFSGDSSSVELATVEADRLEPKNHKMNDTAPRLRSIDASHRSFDEASPPEAGPMSLPLLFPGATTKISEDAPIGYQFAYVKAEDADVGNNGRVTYLLDSLSSGGKFRINRDSGILSVAAQLDREMVNHYSLIIEACDNYDLGYTTGESRRAFTQVNILITDVNDNAPIITSNLQGGKPSSLEAGATGGSPSIDEVMSSPGPYEMALEECLFISEFQATNEPILTISANDADDPNTPNGQIELTIVNNLPRNELFSLVNIQPASTARPSKDQISSAASTPVHQPTEYLSFGDLSMGESAPTVKTLPAPEQSPALSNKSPRASQKHARTRRSAEDIEEASLEPAGNVYHNSKEYAFQQQPRTTSPPIVTSAPEADQPASLMTATMSSIRKRQQNLQNSIVNGDAGEQQVHLIVSQSLKERVGNYSILVRATDRGQPALSSVKLINICVQDVNNHAPLFVRPPLNHTIRIQENSTLGSYVTQVEATDSDHGHNGELQYSFKQTNNNLDWQWFKIDRLSGVISTSKMFNRQLKKYYTLRVQAQDFGKPTSLSNDIDLNIMIVNSGQYQPEFDLQTQHLQFTENVAPGVEWFTLLTTTNLDDDPALINSNLPARTNSPGAADKPAALEQTNWLATPCYFIVDSDDHEQLFHLDRYTHRLTNQKVIDRERKANYTLIVQASNNCSKPTFVPSMLRVGKAADNTEASTLGPVPSIDYRSSTVELSSDVSAVGLDSSDPKTDEVKISRRTRSLPQPANRSLETVRAARLTSAQDQQVYRLSGPALDALLAADKTLLKVVIKVKDVNDNAPKFTQKVYTGGITTEADFGTIFMIVQAIDADADANGQLVYSLLKPIKRNMMSSSSPAWPARVGTKQKRAAVATTSKPQVGLEESTESEPMANDVGPGEADDLFMINAQTGEISLNFDPQRHMKGYFEFEVVAKDIDGLSDSARVLIYLLRQDQRVKFILRLTPQELRQRLDKFRSVMGNITGAIVNIDSYKYYENHDGTVDKKKSSLFLHFVNPEDNTIIEVDKVLTLIDNNIEYLDELYKEFHVLSSEAAQLQLSSSALVDPEYQVRTGLVGITSFLTLILVLLIALFLNQRKRYERQLKAATVSAFGSSPSHLSPDFQSQTNMPNTNLHSQDPNPIWVNGYNDQDWLAGSGGREEERKSGRHLRGGPNVNVGIELDGDYLSSENSDSLSGVNSVHYNATTTATPRDSLNSSHGRVSGSAGSGSTTNERQALCQPANRQTSLSRLGSSKLPAEHGGEPTSVLKKQTKMKAAAAPGSESTHSTFGGAFKEVTIYTDEQLDSKAHQQLRPSFQASNIVKNIACEPIRQQQKQTSQVNKIASQFNSKHQQLTANNHKASNLSQVYIGQHQSQRIIVQANGVDLSQANTNIKNGNNLTITGNRQAQIAPTQTSKAKQLSQHNYSQEQTNTDNIDSNLNKLSILNLETTEL